MKLPQFYHWAIKTSRISLIDHLNNNKKSFHFNIKTTQITKIYIARNWIKNHTHTQNVCNSNIFTISKYENIFYFKLMLSVSIQIENRAFSKRLQRRRLLFKEHIYLYAYSLILMVGHDMDRRNRSKYSFCMDEIPARMKPPSNWNEISEFYFNRLGNLFVRQLRSIKKICVVIYTFTSYRRASLLISEESFQSAPHSGQIRFEPFKKIILFLVLRKLPIRSKNFQVWCGEKPQRLKLVFRNHLKLIRQVTHWRL